MPPRVRLLAKALDHEVLGAADTKAADVAERISIFATLLALAKIEPPNTGRETVGGGLGGVWRSVVTVPRSRTPRASPYAWALAPPRRLPPHARTTHAPRTRHASGLDCGLYLAVSLGFGFGFGRVCELTNREVHVAMVVVFACCAY